MTPEILSVHDASPKFQRELEKIFGGLERAPGKNKWIAVVPFWNREWDIRRYPEFLRLIRAQQSKGWEIILHGYSHSHPQRPPWFHRFFATREGWEFHGLNYAETAALAQPALTIFEEAFGFRPGIHRAELEHYRGGAQGPG